MWFGCSKSFSFRDLWATPPAAEVEGYCKQSRQKGEEEGPRLVPSTDTGVWQGLPENVRPDPTRLSFGGFDWNLGLLSALGKHQQGHHAAEPQEGGHRQKSASKPASPVANQPYGIGSKEATQVSE